MTTDAEVEQMRELALYDAYTRLARIAAASKRLAATRTRREVLEAIEEILVHLVGVDDLAIFEPDARRLVSWHSTQGELHFDSRREPLVTFALRADNVLQATVAIFRMRSGSDVASSDELLAIMCVHAARALHCASVVHERPTIPPIVPS
jgi:hypothetical protein